MSLAGPCANFILTIAAGFAIHLGSWLHFFQAPESANFTRMAVALKPGAADGAATLLSILFSLNLMLGTFNLLPIPPLDGYGIIGLFVNEDLARRRAGWRAGLPPRVAAPHSRGSGVGKL